MTRRVLGWIFFAAIASATTSARGDDAPARLVRDVRTLPVPASSDPRDLVVGTKAWAAWARDARVTRIASIDRGTGAVTEVWSGAGNVFVGEEVGGRLVFTVRTDGAGVVLWSSDGTVAGTAPVATLVPAEVAADLQENVGILGAWETRLVGGVYYFVLHKDLSDEALLATDDGLSVREVFSGDVDSLTPFGAGVMFVGFEPTGGTELWTSDGTVAGTARVADVAPGSESGVAFGSSITVAGSRAFFVADGGEGTEPVELWVTDGTSAGTRAAKPGLVFHYLQDVVAFGERVVFAADDDVTGGEPWVSDGTPDGTFQLADVAPGDAWGAERFLPASDGTYVYFGGDDGVHGREPWRTDGTPEGTIPLADTRADAAPALNEFLALAGGRVVFTATNQFVDLWVTDGTPAGTVRVVQDLGGAAEIARLGAVGLVGAPGPGGGRELWRTDGTVAGTALLEDLLPGPQGSDPARFVVAGGEAYFVATDATAGREVWRTDGTAAGTALFADVAPNVAGSFPVVLAAEGERESSSVTLFAAYGDGTGRELWATDGTSGGTFLVADVAPGEASSSPEAIGVVNRLFVFTADDGVHGREIWVTDGTAAGGAHLLKDVRLGPASSASRGPGVAASGRLVFAADDGVHGAEPWGTDGTPDGTRLLIDAEPGRRGSVATQLDSDLGERATLRVTRCGPWIWFVPDDAASGLWRTDGSPEGTKRVSRLGGAFGADAGPMAVGDRVFVVADERLWQSDGTGGGTRPMSLVVDPLGGAGPAGGAWVFQATPLRAVSAGRGAPALRSMPRPLRLTAPRPSDVFVAGDRTYLVGTDVDDENTGIWTVEPGRSLVPEQAPGLEALASFSTLSCAALPACGRLVLGGIDDAAGFEPWICDGTQAGTHRLADVAPGAAWSDPAGFTLSAGMLLFGADDGTHGRELFAIDAVAALGSKTLEDADQDGAPDEVDLETVDEPRSRTTDVQIDRLTARVEEGEELVSVVVEGQWLLPDAFGLDLAQDATCDVGGVWYGFFGLVRHGNAFVNEPSGRRPIRVVRARGAADGGARVRFSFPWLAGRPSDWADEGVDAAADGSTRVLPVRIEFGGHVAETACTVRVRQIAEGVLSVTLVR